MIVTKEGIELFERSDFRVSQDIGYDWIMDHTHCGLFFEMGLGKTVTTLTAIRDLMYDRLEINHVLLVAPKRVVNSVWIQERDSWTPDVCGDLKIVRVIGNEKQRKAALRESADIHMVSQDNITWLCGLYGGSSLPFDMLVIDESSTFKNRKAIKFKALKRLRECFSRIVLLTGTPAPNTLVDLWSQLFLIDGGERLGRFFNNFSNEYLRAKNPYSRSTALVVRSERAEKEIYELISDVCISMKTEDCVDLPERTNNYIKIDLGSALKKYKAFEKEKVLELLEEGVDITVKSASGLMSKLLQYANGAVYDEDKEYHEVHTLKIEALISIIEETGSPVLVAWSFRHDMYRIMKALKKYKPVQLSSDEDIVSWNNGKIRVLLMHPASGGHGLNLQKGGNTVVWFGPTWNLEHRQQLDKRIHRSGQKNAVIVHHLITVGTIEGRVVRSQDSKSSEQEGLMQAVKALKEEYTK